VIGHIGLHRADDGNVVNTLGDVRKDLADFDAALAVSLKFERGGHDRAGLAFGREVHRGRKFFAGVFRESRLGIERVEMRGAAPHEQVNHPLGLTKKLRLFGREGRIEPCRTGRRNRMRLPRESPATTRPCRRPTGEAAHAVLRIMGRQQS